MARKIKCVDCGVDVEATSNRQKRCPACKKIALSLAALNFRVKNKEKVAAWDREYYQNNKDKVKATVKSYSAKNKEKIAETGKKYREKNKLKIAESKRKYAAENADMIREKGREYRAANKQARSEYRKKWNKENKEKKAVADREYRIKNKSKLAAKGRQRYATDTEYRARDLIRGFCKRAYRGIGKTERTVELIGCTFEYFRAHIEKQFVEGMSWEHRSEWHIDHIIPLASYDLSDPEQVKKACHYSNAQPLWAKDNQQKGAVIPESIHVELEMVL